MIFTSNFSGKADLFDHISGLGGWYDKDGNPVKFGQEGVNVYYSDEMQDFLEFKRRTGGKLYQHYKVEVTEYNYDMIREHCPAFNVIEHKEVKADARTKSGEKEVITYTYEYYGREYKTLKELNKHGVYITYTIYFNTILDLIQYYPYLITSSCCSDGKETVFISRESFVEEEFKDHLRFSCSNLKQYYKDKLQVHYMEVCNNYLLKDLDERTHLRSIYDFVKIDLDDPNSDYYIEVPEEIDDNHKLCFHFTECKLKPYWQSPSIYDTNKIRISNQDINNYLAEDIRNRTVSIEYVEKLKDNIILG